MSAGVYATPVAALKSSSLCCPIPSSPAKVRPLLSVKLAFALLELSDITIWAGRVSDRVVAPEVPSTSRSAICSSVVTTASCGASTSSDSDASVRAALV